MFIFSWDDGGLKVAGRSEEESPVGNEAVLKAMYEGFNQRRMEDVLAQLHPEVDWPNGMEGGRMMGREAVREYWTRQWGMIDPHVEPVAMEEDGDGRMVVTVRQVVKDLGGTVLADDKVLHMYSFAEGMVVRMEIREG